MQTIAVGGIGRPGHGAVLAMMALLTATLAMMFAVGVSSRTDTSSGGTPVVIVNRQGVSLYVAFTNQLHQPGAITWGAGCTPSGKGALVAGGTTCTATVINNGIPTRFCASRTVMPTDCWNAQTLHQTMVETNFQASCFGKGSCVWYDISVIPSTCTNALWAANQCANAGGASYNVPVSLSCPGSATYTCQGPASSKYGAANYPSNCGNPNATCTGNTSQCLNAYFYPMAGMNPQPNTVCLAGQPFTITYLAGQ